MVINARDQRLNRDKQIGRGATWYGESFSRFRGRHGEFAQWMHVFAVRAGLGPGKTATLDILKIAPWVFDDKTIDREVLLSLFRLGAMKSLPAHWSNDNWDWLDTGVAGDSDEAWRFSQARAASPLYAVLAPGMSGQALCQKLEGLSNHMGLDARSREFWEAMRPYVLLPATDGSLVPSVVAELTEQADFIHKELSNATD